MFLKIKSGFFYLFKYPKKYYINQLKMVAVAQLVRASVCGTGCRGFKSPQPPHLFFLFLLKKTNHPIALILKNYNLMLNLEFDEVFHFSHL